MNKASVSLGLLLWVSQAWAVPDGPIADAKPVTQVAPEGAMAARLAYNVGYEDFDKAQAAAASAAKLNGASAKAAQAQALKDYASARTQFEAAAKADPSLKEAWNLIGYTSRRLGEYDKALAAYEQALALNPTYSEAIEYRAEAYLALNRLDDAKAAYLTLLANARPHAAVLLESMQNWLAERRKQPAGVAAAELDAFARWVEERAAVARQTASLAPDFIPVRRWD